MVDFKSRSDEEWRKALSPEQYRVTREAGTDRAFSGQYNDFKEEGTFLCTCCEATLFSSDSKYDSGSGWPSFFQAEKKGNVLSREDASLGVKRVEVLCARCEAHLGHVFEDGPQPTGQRYCINSTSLKFSKESDKNK